MNKEDRFVVIGRTPCGACDATKNFLRGRASFKYYDSGLMEPDELALRLEGLRIMSFPVIFYEGKFIGGFKELVPFFKTLPEEPSDI